MRVFTYGLKVVEGSVGTRVCLLLVLVFFSSIDRSNSSVSDAASNSTTDVSFRHPSNLTNQQQLQSVVTIEFNFKHIDPKNRTALNAAYRAVRRKILAHLNSRNPTIPTTATTLVTEAISTTMSTSTTTSRRLTDPVQRKRRKRSSQNSGGNDVTYTDENLFSIKNDPEIDENGNLRMSFLLDAAGLNITDLFELLHQTIKELNDTGELEQAGGGAVVNIYRGLPPIVTAKTTEAIETTVAAETTVTAVTTVEVQTTVAGGTTAAVQTTVAGGTTAAVETTVAEGTTAAVETTVAEGTTAAVETTVAEGTTAAVATAHLADYRVWLPILLAILLLLIVFVSVFCWRATSKKVKNGERKKISPKLDSKPDSSNGHAPRILDDNHGWLIPYEQFNNDTTIEKPR